MKALKSRVILTVAKATTSSPSVNCRIAILYRLDAHVATRPARQPFAVVLRRSATGRHHRRAAESFEADCAGSRVREMRNSNIPDPAAFHQLRDEEERFESALGRFVMTYADAEAELYQVLLRYAEVSDPVGRAIFSGMRASGMIDTLTSIASNVKSRYGTLQ